MIRLLSSPAKPDANEKNRIAVNLSQPEYDAIIKQTARPTIPKVRNELEFRKFN